MEKADKKGISFVKPEGWFEDVLDDPLLNEMDEKAGLKESVIAFNCPWDFGTFIQFIPALPKGEKESPTVKEIWEETIAEDKENLNDYKVISQKSYKINNLDADELLTEGQMDGKKVISRYVIISNVKEYVEFILSTSDEQFIKANEVFDKILQSVKES